MVSTIAAKLVQMDIPMVQAVITLVADVAKLKLGMNFNRYAQREWEAKNISTP